MKSNAERCQSKVTNGKRLLFVLFVEVLLLKVGMKVVKMNTSW